MVMRLQQFAPQIVPIPFRHCRFAAESRRNHLYTYIEIALNTSRDWTPGKGTFGAGSRRVTVGVLWESSDTEAKSGGVATPPAR